MPERPLAAVITLGCKLNLADSEEIALGLRRVGFDTVSHVCEAQAYVINTCSVTHVADSKSRGLIRSIRRLSPTATIAVTGCFPQSAGHEAITALGADIVTGTRDADKATLISHLATANATAQPAESPQPPLHTRAFIKVQEGCNDVCAFCIVPRTRGREESRTIDRVVDEVTRATESGVREAILTGTQLGAWGRDLPTPLKPHHLIAAVLERTAVPRLRFSSLQPQDITPELLALWDDPRLMPHFHLALQSGSETTLAAMRRRYTAVDYLAAVHRISAASPDAAITTDVIAGFPGETEADFEATLALCREAQFAAIHAFPYSKRSRTTAAAMPGHLPVDVVKERMARLTALGTELAATFRARFEGTIRPVLWETQQEVDGQPRWFGHTDNYIGVYQPGEALRNRITPSRLGQPCRGGLEGTPVAPLPLDATPSRTG